MSSGNLAKVEAHKFIHMTPFGRRTGKPPIVELWFAIANDNLYLSHEGQETDWTKTIAQNSEVTYEIGGKRFKGRRRYAQDGAEETSLEKAALYEKYYGKAERETIEDWFSLSKLLMIEPIE